ncbi:MAG: hypothetical protein IKU07_09425 [Oscillospiraceae bacterium]|nr:hypothetical protein [Oscillospiraceae bacterium]
MQKILDMAIKRSEVGESSAGGYRVKGRALPYENYMENAAWNECYANMQKNHEKAFAAYGAGGGKELDERVSGTNTYPPKMASYGSSSRMIYTLMQNEENFEYEKKLPTLVGGVANLDGFAALAEKCVFVEAKCREPYGAKSDLVSDKYEALYQYLTGKDDKVLTCNCVPAGKGKLAVSFLVGENKLKLEHFDMKQMLCHLLGIGVAYLRGEYEKKIDFIYLLYNPNGLPFDKEAHRKKIMDIYAKECAEFESVDFTTLFYHVLCYLTQVEKLEYVQEPEQLKALFSARMCDQHTMNL